MDTKTQTARVGTRPRTENPLHPEPISPEILVAGGHLLQQVGDVVRGARHVVSLLLADYVPG